MKQLSVVAITVAVSLMLTHLAPSPARANGAPGVEGGQMIIEGALIGEGVECPLFRLPDGERITLTGESATLELRKAVRLKGQWLRISTCMQGRTFSISEILEAE